MGIWGRQTQPPQEERTNAKVLRLECVSRAQGLVGRTEEPDEVGKVVGYQVGGEAAVRGAEIMKAAGEDFGFCPQ